MSDARQDRLDPETVGLLVDLLRREQERGRRIVHVEASVLDHLSGAGAAADSGAARRPARLGSPPAPASAAIPRPVDRAEQGGDSVVEATAGPVSNLNWEELEAAVHACRACRLWRSRKNAVVGEGNRSADLMFIGEAPGVEEDFQGRPFVGAAGQLLTRMIEAMQFRREDVYIANVVKCHPPGNRDPREDEAATCLPFLRRQIELISPKVIVLLGAVPLRFVMGKTGIHRHRGQWLELNGIPVMPTYHPAYLFHSPKAKRSVWEDLQKVMRLLGKDPAKTPRRQSRR